MCQVAALCYPFAVVDATRTYMFFLHMQSDMLVARHIPRCVYIYRGVKHKQLYIYIHSGFGCLCAQADVYVHAYKSCCADVYMSWSSVLVFFLQSFYNGCTRATARVVHACVFVCVLYVLM